jgi:glucose/arabinose dehydrogenase
MMAVGDDGTVYLTRPGSNDAVALSPEGRLEEQIVSGLELAHGIAIHDHRMYLAGVRTVIAADLRDGRLGRWRTVIEDLPPGGAHPLRTIGFGPDGMLYVSIGSTCNVCREADPRYATILRARPDGRRPTIFARGLRNTEAFAWHPATRRMWGVDNGPDGIGDDEPPEELNRLVRGGDYGWPWCLANRRPDPLITEDPKPGLSRKAYCARTLAPVVTYQAHSAPVGMAFYTGTQFPREYRGDAFVAFHGSWNREPPSGYKVARIRFARGKPIRFEEFLSGFLVDGGEAQFGRPSGLAVMKDGSLLVSDDTGGVIYRVSYPRLPAT